MLFARSALALMFGASMLVTPPAVTAGDPPGLLDELRSLVEKSRRERAADRWLQNALEDLLAKHDSPWQREILYDDFADGDYNRSPTWQVMRGQFQVLRGQGLYCSATGDGATTAAEPASPPQSTGEALSGLIVGALLDQALGPAPQTAASASGPNEIRVKANVGNAFAIDLGFRHAADSDGAFEIVLLQSEAGNYGYRLRVQSGLRGFVELQRIRGGRGAVVDSRDLAPGLADGMLHELTWRQRPDGMVSVMIDGKGLMEVRDRAFRDPYPWLHLINDQGELTVRSVRVSGV